MQVLLKVVGFLGVFDSLWLAVDRAGWARFWGQGIERAGRDRQLAYALAAAELAVSLALIWFRPHRSQDS